MKKCRSVFHDNKINKSLGTCTKLKSIRLGIEMPKDFF